MKGKKRSLSSLSLFLSSVCVVVVVVRTHRAWCVLKAKKRKKKKRFGKIFFARARKGTKYIAHSFRFFLSLSFSFSPVVVVVVACHHPEREREREREVRASLQKRSSSLVSRNILVCALSLFFRCCSEYFLFFFFMKRKWIKKSGLWSFQIFRRDFLIQKVPLAFAPFNLRKNSRATTSGQTRDDGILRTRDRERKKNKTLFIYHRTRIFLLWEIRVNNNSSTRSWRKCSPPSTKTKTYKTTIPRKG